MMIILRQKEFTRAEKEAMFQLMRLTKGFKSLPKELNSVENAKRFKKFSNRLVKFANDPEAHKFTAEELKEMKGFLNDIGATKFADNFEPIVNKYYGNNVEAWQRLKLRETRMPKNELVRRDNRLFRRYRDVSITGKEANLYLDAPQKLTKGKSSKEIFSSPDGNLMKKIVKGETGGVDQPSIYFNNVKGRNKIESYLEHDGDGSDYGRVFINHADLATLSHELGHAKSLADSIAAGTPDKEMIYRYSKKLSAPLRETSAKRLGAMYFRLNNLSTIASENMANVYGKDIIRKYGGKNVDKHLANYEKFVDKGNMKAYLAASKFKDIGLNLDMTGRIINILDGKV